MPIDVPRVAAVATEKFDPPLTELDSLRQPLTEGERRVVEFLLENLGSRWEVYIQPHLNGLRPDFVLLNPDVGIAVIEVKDWDLAAMRYYYKSRGKSAPELFGRNETREFSLKKADPVAKIQLYKKAIMDIFCPRLAPKKGFGVITGCVIFPNADTEAVERILYTARAYYGQIDFPKWNTVVGKDQLEAGDIKKLLVCAFKQRDDQMDPRQAEDLRHWLVEPEVSREQRGPLLSGLDKRQLDLINTRTKSRFRRIRGPAGSGKSVILAARAAKLAGEGKRVLLITFNITLINYLLDYAVRYGNSGKIRDQIVAWNFHFWCKVMAGKTGHWTDYDDLWLSGSPERVLDDRLAGAAKEWVSDLDDEERFDAIFVDEGQDFRLEWWLALRAALAEGGEMLLCADRAQNIYGISQTWTDNPVLGSGLSGQWADLRDSYRMPPKLCTLAAEYLERYSPHEDNLRPMVAAKNLDFGFGENLNWVQVREGMEVEKGFDYLFKIVAGTEPVVAIADVTVIVEDEDIGKEFITKLMKEKGIRCIDTFKPDQGEKQAREMEARRKKLAFFKGDARVKVTTLQSFKGWESTALVVFITKAQGPEDLALVYAGITRLKVSDRGCFLLVVCSQEKLLPFGAKWPHFSDLRAIEDEGLF